MDPNIRISFTFSFLGFQTYRRVQHNIDICKTVNKGYTPLRIGVVILSKLLVLTTIGGLITGAKLQLKLTATALHYRYDHATTMLL